MLLAAVTASAAFTASRGATVSRGAVVHVRRCARPVAGVQELDADAAALLEEVNGDAVKARTSYIGYTLAYLKDAQPELYEAIRDDPSQEDAHAALVEITWDAIAAFLPVTHDPTPTPAAQKKLAAIARVGCDSATPSPATLDIGCGTGLLLPFLGACGAPMPKYLGIDVSSRMIGVAQDSHSEPRFDGATFEEVSFRELAARPEAAGAYDAIFFNGALQFFADPAGALAMAARLLAPGGGSRLVISHLNGAAFVRKEQEENPTTVLSRMPSLAQLEQVAGGLGMQVALPSFFGTEPDEIEAGMDDFYLAVLRWDAAHGGVDGVTGALAAEGDAADAEES